MTHRKIKDGDGRAWDVWEVYPAAVERRMSGEHPAVPQERRSDSNPRREIRLRIPAGLEQGWLAFQAGEDRRRLAPIPDDWIAFADEAIVALLLRADRITDGDGKS
jgi:hypothetical protein